MIIHLDSNYRNKSLYPNPGNYVIDINGTPPDNSIMFDSRGCYETTQALLFSFQYFQYYKGTIPYESFMKNGLWAVKLKFYDQDLFNLIDLYSENAQNFLVGYEVVDIETRYSSLITNSFKNQDSYFCILQNKISNQNKGKLTIQNPSKSLKYNLLINGFSKFNQVPGQGFYQNEGVDLNSVIINLTKNKVSRIQNLIFPYRNIIIENKDFDWDNGDYLAVYNQKNDYNLNLSIPIINVFPVSLYTFDILSINFDINDTNIGDLFLSDFGDLSDDPVIPIIDNYIVFQEDYFVTSPSRKIVLMVKNIVKNNVVFQIVNPGNQIIKGTSYTLRKIDNNLHTILIRAKSTSYCLKLNEDINFNTKNSFMFFLSKFISIPFYSVVQTQNSMISKNLLFIENPDFFYKNSIYFNSITKIFIYYKIAFLYYFNYFPNLPLPLSNTPLACYEIILTSISLPNLPICGTNLLLADFPYVFVTFGNSTNIDPLALSSTLSIGGLYSNNPNALYATFLCPIANIRSPDIVKYVVVRSGQIVTAKLNLSENLRFCVYLPDGSLLQFSERYLINFFSETIQSSTNECNNQDNLTTPTFIFPYNDYISISATFTIDKL